MTKKSRRNSKDLFDTRRTGKRAEKYRLFRTPIAKQSLAIVEVLTSEEMYGIINYDSKITADHAH